MMMRRELKKLKKRVDSRRGNREVKKGVKRGDDNKKDKQRRLFTHRNSGIPKMRITHTHFQTFILITIATKRDLTRRREKDE